MFQVSTDIMNMDMHMLHAVFLFVVFGSCSLDVQYLYIYILVYIYILYIIFYLFYDKFISYCKYLVFMFNS